MFILVNINSMNVIIIFTYGISMKAWDYSGILEREVEIYKRLQENHGVKFTFITFGDEEDEEYSYLFNNFKIIPIYKYLKKSNSKIIDVIKTSLVFLKFKNVLPKKAIIKTNQLNGAWLGIFMKIFLKYPLYLRTGYNLFAFSVKNKKKFLVKVFHYCLTQICLFIADVYSVTSNVDRNYLESKFLNSNKIIVVPNWVIDIRENSFENRLSNRVLSVGRLEMQKNYFALIKSFSKADVGLDIVGEGSLKLSLIQEAINFETDLHLLGKLDHNDLNQKYLNYRIFISPSFFEGNPKVVLEAMSKGVLVVARKNENIMEIIKHNVNGILYDDRDNLNQIVSKLLTDKALIEKLVTKAYTEIREINHIDVVINKELEIYKKISNG